MQPSRCEGFWSESCSQVNLGGVKHLQGVTINSINNFYKLNSYQNGPSRAARWFWQPRLGWRWSPCWSWWSWTCSGCHHEWYKQLPFHKLFSKMPPRGAQVVLSPRFMFFASHPDHVQKFYDPPIFWLPGHQDGSNDTPILTLAPRIRFLAGELL